ILPDGKMFSTENLLDYELFELHCTALFTELNCIRDEIISNQVLYKKIRDKYQTKNTVGYSLNAFLDHEHPLDIFAHLLVGGEGTLAFISEAVMRTIPDKPYKSTALLYFPDIYSACKTIVPLVNAGAEMVELMDRASLRSIEKITGIDSFISTLPENAAALLIEFQENSTQDLELRTNSFLKELIAFPVLNPPEFTVDYEKREFYWKIRKGLFPAVGAVRASGTTVILEDITFPIALLGDAILDLQKLFKKYLYHNAIVFGHAKDGNIHFVITQSLDTDAEIDRYDRFIREVVTLVVNKYNGSLKAEHGTGRNMAPFVETEWGTDAYRIMKRIKAAADPMNLLNPGVIINDDAKAHIHDLKDLPAVEEEVDKCIECGYCEHKCPSRDLTMTPRRRIIARRELVRMQNNGQRTDYKTLLQQYQYDGLDTCAVDGLCAGACPVDINTGDLVKRLRRENHSQFSNSLANFAANHFLLVQILVRLALRAGTGINSIMGKNSMLVMTKRFKKIIPSFPLWSNQIAAPPELSILKKSAESEINTNAESIVYFASCISRVLGSSVIGKKSILETFLSVSAKAGINVIVPKHFAGSCCGQIFSSKGFNTAYQFTANKIINELWDTSSHGKYPVVMDVSSCTYTLHHLRPSLSSECQKKYDQIRIIDSINYLHDHVIPHLNNIRKKDRIALHPVCSLQKLGTEDTFLRVARFFADEVVVPLNSGCCGMAGDRGFLFPELTRAATSPEAKEVLSQTFRGYYSSTKTCEMAMSEAVNQNYESILYLVDQSSD
ncbi:MAG: FAD-linked oxidase C-terminal domain-containing protein, partial [Flavitalea sp.]